MTTVLFAQRKQVREHWPKLARGGMIERQLKINGTVSSERTYFPSTAYVPAAKPQNAYPIIVLPYSASPLLAKCDCPENHHDSPPTNPCFCYNLSYSPTVRSLLQAAFFIGFFLP